MFSVIVLNNNYVQMIIENDVTTYFNHIKRKLICLAKLL